MFLKKWEYLRSYSSRTAVFCFNLIRSKILKSFTKLKLKPVEYISKHCNKFNFIELHFFLFFKLEEYLRGT